MAYRAIREDPANGDVSDVLRPIFEEDVRFSLALAGHLCILADVLQSHGARFLPIKGPLLSQRLYGDVAIRASGDLDILTAGEQVVAIKDVLVAEGYRIASPLHWPGDSACLRSRECELLMDHQTRPAVLDLHWRAVPEYFASAFDKLRIWDESLISSRFYGRDLPDLSADRLLLFLCAHAAKHAFERLGWIADIAACLRSPDLNWTSILSATRGTATTRQLLVGIHLAATLFGSTIPTELPSDAKTELLVSLAAQRLLSAQTPPTREAELIPFCLRLLETGRHRLRYLAGHLSPSAAEYELVRLPPPLYILYYPLRPLRLALKHAFAMRSAGQQ